MVVAGQVEQEVGEVGDEGDAQPQPQQGEADVDPQPGDAADGGENDHEGQIGYGIGEVGDGLRRHRRFESQQRRRDERRDDRGRAESDHEPVQPHGGHRTGPVVADQQHHGDVGDGVEGKVEIVPDRRRDDAAGVRDEREADVSGRGQQDRQREQAPRPPRRSGARRCPPAQACGGQGRKVVQDQIAQWPAGIDRPAHQHREARDGSHEDDPHGPAGTSHPGRAGAVTRLG